MLRICQVEARSDELFSADDPAAFAAVAATRVFATRRTTVADAVVVVAPRNAIHIRHALAAHLPRHSVGKTHRLWPDCPVNGDVMAAGVVDALNKLDRKDVTVANYGDSENSVCSYCYKPIAKVVDAAVEMLESMIRGGKVIKIKTLQPEINK